MGLAVGQLGQAGSEGDLTPAIYRYNGKNQMIEATNNGETVNNVFNPEGLRGTPGRSYPTRT